MIKFALSYAYEANVSVLCFSTQIKIQMTSSRYIFFATVLRSKGVLIKKTSHERNHSFAFFLTPSSMRFRRILYICDGMCEYMFCDELCDYPLWSPEGLRGFDKFTKAHLFVYKTVWLYGWY